MPSLPSHDPAWWKEAVVYQIYPRSFQDSNGDGIGDLPGIQQRLDHLADLGIDVVWLSPVYDSPMADNGYDIRSYRSIAPVFGSMADFDAVLHGLHDRGIRLVMDLVVNHTSDEHRWFEASRSHPDNPYRDYYIWRPPGPDGGPPNNWVSFFGGPAWTYDETTGEYYLHLFDPKQPDLNWDNPDVRRDIHAMMRFWLEKGVDGFRMDVITFISKHPDFPPLPDGADPFRHYANGPHLHRYLREMNDAVLSDFDCMTVGESWGVRAEEALDFVAQDRKELQTFFFFDHVQLTRQPDDHYAPRDWTLPEIKAVFDRWDDAFAEDGWMSLFLGNHDLPRMVSMYGDDRPAYRVPSAKLLHTFLLTMRGTPYVYQGDEIGMTNAPFETLDDFEDVSTIGDVREKVAAGADREAVLDAHRLLGRDNARTPVPWTDGPHGGFTTGTPWLPVNPDRDTLNVEAARTANDGIYAYLQDLIALRRAHEVLVYGTYTNLLPKDEQIWAYRRTLGDATVWIVLNWSSEPAPFRFPEEVDVDRLHRWTTTVSDPTALAAEMTLQPWEGMVVSDEAAAR